MGALVVPFKGKKSSFTDFLGVLSLTIYDKRGKRYLTINWLIAIKIMKVSVDVEYLNGYPLGVEKNSSHTNEIWSTRTLLGRIQDVTKGGSDKRPPKAVVPRGVRGHAPPENF